MPPKAGKGGKADKAKEAARQKVREMIVEIMSMSIQK